MEPYSSEFEPRSKRRLRIMISSPESKDEEVNRLKDLLEQKDRELLEREIRLKRTEEELERTKWQLTDIAQRNRIFYQFRTLPPELRHLVYGKMPMFDRVAAARVSQEMEDYFTKHRLIGWNTIYLKEEEGKCYVKVVYKISVTTLDRLSAHDDIHYAEMHLIPANLLPVIQNELQSSAECTCEFCLDTVSDRVSDIQVRYFVDGNLDNVFRTMRLFTTSEVDLKSSPFGGLVDLLQPKGKLVKQKYSVALRLFWHPKKSDVISVRNDPRINLDHWEKWFDYWAFSAFNFFKDMRGEVFIHKGFFDFQLVQNAYWIESECNADINIDQLLQLKCTWMVFSKSIKLTCINSEDLLKFYKARIKEWMASRSKNANMFTYEFNWFDNTANPPHLDFRRLFEDMKDDLKPERFRLYSNFLDWYHQWDEFEGIESVTLRCMRTNQLLGVTANKLLSEQLYHDEEFPDYIRF